MCGICGRISVERPGDDGLVRRLQAALRHRGPDDEGYFADGPVELAMRRLSIIDLAGGAQPLFNEDGRVALVLNGEIYNHVELRADLENRGHCFATRSDAEVLVHLYEDEGLDAVKRLRGMFAFALWDAARRRLVLGRDRMGEKPLYLAESSAGLVFASEMKALVGAGAVDCRLDARAVHRYFYYSYVPEPETILSGVRKLPAGSLLVIDTAPWRVTAQRYWRMLDAPPVEVDPPKAIRAALEDIAHLIVRADVPVGVALSGGLDSSAVAALVAREAPRSVQAFSVGYPHRPAYDERAAAAALAAHLDLPFHEVEIGLDEMVGQFADLILHRDDPIADIAGQGYFAVARAARQAGVPVLLQGHGGDEMFWGYSLTRDGLAHSRDRAARRRWGALAWLRYLNTSAHVLGSQLPKRHVGWRSTFGDARRRWQRDTAAGLGEPVFYENAPDFAAAPLDLARYADPAFLQGRDPRDPLALFAMEPGGRLDLHLTEQICATYLVENGIAQGDRLSMANGVELRLPLVDHRLVELVIGLRKARPDDRLPAKAWLRAAVADLLPAEVLDRPKQGFCPPLRSWHAALFAAYGDQLRDGRLVEAGVLSSAGAAELARGPFPDGAVAPFSFRALVLETWLRGMQALAARSRRAAEDDQRPSRARPIAAGCAAEVR